jgi:transcriptional regulator with GAF, ATPase, and Fis domain
VDWLQELSGSRASDIFTLIEDGLKQGTLVREDRDRFRFQRPEERDRLRERLPAGERNRLSQAIAHILLKEVPKDDRALEHVGAHLLRISNDAEGCRWLFRTGELYRLTYRYSEALRCYKKILSDLEKDASEDAAQVYAEAAIGYSKISDAETEFHDVIAALDAALQRILPTEDAALLARLELHLAKNQWLFSKFEEALEHFNRGREIAARLEAPRIRRSLASFSTFFFFVQGRFKDVVHYYEEFLPEVEKYPKARFPLLSAVVVGFSYALTGQVTKGMGMMDAIYLHAEENGDLYVASFAAYVIGVALWALQRNEEALQYFRDAVSKAEKAPNHLSLQASLIYMAAVYYRKGDIALCRRYYGRYVDFRRKMKVRREVTMCLLELAWAVFQGRLPPLAELSLEEEIQNAMEGKNLAMQAVGHHYRALVQRHRCAASEEVIASLETAAKLLEAAGSYLAMAQTNIELAREHLRQGQERKARKCLRQIVGLIETAGKEFVPEDLQFLLSDLRTDRNLLQEIIKMGQELVTIKENRELVKRIISTAIAITGAERGAIFLADPKGSGSRADLTLRASKNLTQEDVDGPSFSASLEVIRQTAITGEGRIVRKRSEGESVPPSRGSIRACICVPMKRRDEVVGVLYHDNRLLGSSFRESDLEILGYFSALATIAMDNAEAYEEIRNLNERLAEEKQYYQEQHLESAHFEEIVGKSRAILKVLSSVSQVAETDATVLILGETGVGKELVARAIHERSLRKEGPFIRVACSALPENLIASELFGHEKGAFTGAVSRRIGRFELADKGTLFLDEIGDIPPEVQVRLLRALQTREFERIGGGRTVRSDFRLIAATNRDLEKAVKEGWFREDLFYRLNVFPIHVPPLRERREDIPLLTRYFLQIYAGKFGKSVMRASDADLSRLSAYNWPGNVRELENYIERGVILSSGTRFQMPELGRQGSLGSDRPVSLQENERRHILWALEMTGGKIRGEDGAARLLDIHPNTLYNRMKRLGIRASKENRKRA